MDFSSIPCPQRANAYDRIKWGGEGAGIRHWGGYNQVPDPAMILAEVGRVGCP